MDHAELEDRATYLELDARRRASLGSIAKHDRYLATVEPDGTIMLTPAVVMTAAEAQLHRSGAVVEGIDRFLDEPSTGAVRRRPSSSRPR